jgi:hypothetical protein
MGRKFKIQRVANITAPDGTQSVFYEIWDVISVDGKERLHRNADIAFTTEKEAQNWINEQEAKGK